MVRISTWFFITLQQDSTLCIAVKWVYQVINLLASSYDLWPQPGSDFPEELMIVPQGVLWVWCDQPLFELCCSFFSLAQLASVNNNILWSI